PKSVTHCCFSDSSNIEFGMPKHESDHIPA
ncbi:MAG: hypothetical protein ACI8T1_004998, partial [Verrucomicrobiales bacterium]